MLACSNRVLVLTSLLGALNNLIQPLQHTLRNITTAGDATFSVSNRIDALYLNHHVMQVKHAYYVL